MWILREKIIGFNIQVSEVTATTTRHQNFFTGLVGFLQYQNLAPASGCCDSAHETSGTCAEYDDVVDFWQCNLLNRKKYSVSWVNDKNKYRLLLAALILVHSDDIYLLNGYHFGVGIAFCGFYIS